MKRLIPLKILAAACVLGLIGCSPAAPAKNAKDMSGEELQVEQQRCKELGLNAYEDKACGAAKDEQWDRFMGNDKAAKP